MTINLVIDIDREGVAHYYICAVSIKIINIRYVYQTGFQIMLPSAS